MASAAIRIPESSAAAEIRVSGKVVRLTNLDKLFWRAEHITKRQLLQYYENISPVLLPHLTDRAMVMKRYPDGADGEFFFQKRAPRERPDWVPICNIMHPSASLVDFPM